MMKTPATKAETRAFFLSAFTRSFGFVRLKLTSLFDEGGRKKMVAGGGVLRYLYFGVEG